VSSLKLFLLGPPRIEYDARPVEIRRRTTLALLVYLAVTGESQRRDTLATLLWPDSPQSSARAALRRDLSILNKSLGGEWLEIDRETAALRRGPGFWLDVEQFQQHVGVGRTHNHPPHEVCFGCLPPLTQAVALYRDDFLAGFTLSDSPDFDEWQFFQTEGLRQTLASALERLVRGYSAQGESELAISYARRWLTLDPLHEPAHQCLMQLYAWVGQRAAALRQYRECVRLLEKELGVTPSDETTGLYRAIKARQVPSAPVMDQALMPGGPPVSIGERGPSDSRVAAPPALRPNNLPAQTTAFIGRVAELAAVRARLSRPEVRLLTLTGPGGAGKTRLGLRAATDILDDFPNGVFFVDLGPIRDPALVGRAIAETLGVRETGDRSTWERLKDYLKHKELLLLLDSFEHLLPAAPLVTDLLAVAPGLKALVTSRALLRLDGEWDHPVPPLRVPDPDHLPPIERLAEYEAVQLFVARARAVKAGFALTAENAPAVAEICARVDGLPLAIELAAARARVLPPHKILAQLSDRLGFLTGGARDWPARQRTLRDTIDWSYDLLEAEEQTLFRRLAVFSGGCTLEAAEAVGMDVLKGLESLVDKNLLKQSELGDEPRFGMLDTIREYALERLAAEGEAEEDAVRQRHAHFFLRLAEEAEPNIYGTEQVVWLNRLEIEHDNLRVALAWSIDHAIDVGLRLVGALGRFWHFRGHHHEGQDWLAKALASSEGADLEGPRAKALDRAGYLAFFLGDIERACALCQESVRIWRELGDQRGLAHALCDLGSAVNAGGDPARARNLLEESIALFRQIEDKPGLVRALFWHGHVAYLQRDFVRARASAEETITLGREVGNTSNVASATDTLGMIAFHEGDYAAAQSFLEESLRLMREVEDKLGIAIMLDLLGGIAYTQGRYGQARLCFEESHRIWQELGSKPEVAWGLYFLGYVALRQGHLRQAAKLFTESLLLYQELEAKADMARCWAGLAEVAKAEGRPERAARLWGAMHAALQSLGTHLEVVDQDRYAHGPEHPMVPSEAPPRGCTGESPPTGLHRGNVFAATSQAEQEREVAALRTELSGDAFAAAWAEGQAMTLEQALVYAMVEGDR
jgi:predicted ATPase/DNA-binding SARP family transcriptional activator